MEDSAKKPKPLANIFLKELIDYTDELKKLREENLTNLNKASKLMAQIDCLETLRERIFHLALINYPKKK